MRHLRAYLTAMRTRRTGIDLTRADSLAAGDRAGSDHPGLDDLLTAARAPARADELSGEKAMVAAYTAHRRSAARTARRHHRTSVRTVIVACTTGLALLTLGGTAVAARTGNLPEEAQQHAHRLFSALGVPAPRTGNTPRPTTTPSPGGSAPTPSPDITALRWCEAWRAEPDNPSLTTENERRLIARAGSESRILGYCDKLRKSAPAASAPTPSRPAAPPTPAGSAAPPPNAPPSNPPGTGTPPTTPGQPPTTAQPEHGNPDAGNPGSGRDKAHPTHPTHPTHPSPGGRGRSGAADPSDAAG